METSRENSFYLLSNLFKTAPDVDLGISEEQPLIVSTVSVNIIPAGPKILKTDSTNQNLEVNVDKK